MGGAVAAIEKGFMQREIMESSYLFQKDVEKNERIVVGVNEFSVEEKVPIKLLRIDPRIERELCERLERLKQRRNHVEVNNALDKLHSACSREGVNLVPVILEAVKQYVTLGEICDTLRDEFGEYKPPSIF